MNLVLAIIVIICVIFDQNTALTSYNTNNISIQPNNQSIDYFIPIKVLNSTPSETQFRLEFSFSSINDTPITEDWIYGSSREIMTGENFLSHLQYNPITVLDESSLGKTITQPYLSIDSNVDVQSKVIGFLVTFFNPSPAPESSQSSSTDTGNPINQSNNSSHTVLSTYSTLVTPSFSISKSAAAINNPSSPTPGSIFTPTPLHPISTTLDTSITFTNTVLRLNNHIIYTIQLHENLLSPSLIFFPRTELIAFNQKFKLQSNLSSNSNYTIFTQETYSKEIKDYVQSLLKCDLIISTSSTSSALTSVGNTSTNTSLHSIPPASSSSSQITSSYPIDTIILDRGHIHMISSHLKLEPESSTITINCSIPIQSASLIHPHQITHKITTVPSDSIVSHSHPVEIPIELEKKQSLFVQQFSLIINTNSDYSPQIDNYLNTTNDYITKNFTLYPTVDCLHHVLELFILQSNAILIQQSTLSSNSSNDNNPHDTSLLSVNDIFISSYYIWDNSTHISVNQRKLNPSNAKQISTLSTTIAFLPHLSSYFDIIIMLLPVITDSTHPYKFTLQRIEQTLQDKQTTLHSFVPFSSTPSTLSTPHFTTDQLVNKNTPYDIITDENRFYQYIYAEECKGLDFSTKMLPLPATTVGTNSSLWSTPISSFFSQSTCVKGGIGSDCITHQDCDQTNGLVCLSKTHPTVQSFIKYMFTQAENDNIVNKTQAGVNSVDLNSALGEIAGSGVRAVLMSSTHENVGIYNNYDHLIGTNNAVAEETQNNNTIFLPPPSPSSIPKTTLSLQDNISSRDIEMNNIKTMSLGVCLFPPSPIMLNLTQFSETLLYPSSTIDMHTVVSSNSSYMPFPNSFNFLLILSTCALLVLVSQLLFNPTIALIFFISLPILFHQVILAPEPVAPMTNIDFSINSALFSQLSSQASSLDTTSNNYIQVILSMFTMVFTVSLLISVHVQNFASGMAFSVSA